MSNDGASCALRRSMGLFQLTMLGVGATVGTGIFVALTTAVPAAGPAVIVSFLIAGATAALSALCYAELASAMPAAGSAYSYARVAFGNTTAFLIGACLLLEYGVSVAAIAAGWGQYVNELLSSATGWTLPDALARPPGAGGVLNLPAVMLVALCTALLTKGARESASVNAALVLVKIGVLAFFVAVAATGFSAANLHPFAPHGLGGIGAAASAVFFSYIGIDAVSTAGEEVRDPQRTLPRAIVLSLLIVTALYMLVALAAIGAQPWTAFAGQEAGLSVILRNLTGAPWPAMLLAGGAIVSIFSVTLVVIYGQTRILFAMARDGLLPATLGRVNARGVPAANTLIAGTVIAVLAAMVPLDVLVNLTSMGTLIALAAVSAAVMVLRRTRADLPRRFRVPLYPVLPIASVIACGYLIAALPLGTWAMFIAWLALAVAFRAWWQSGHGGDADAERASGSERR